MNDNDDRDAARDAPEDDGGDVAESTELGSLLTHFYRAEMDRVTAWRQRLDETTTWTVTIIAAVLAYGFSADGTHVALLAGMVITTAFLIIEARRYQDYDVWRSRVRLLQENLFADALAPREGPERGEWRRDLSDDLRSPAVKTPYVEAFARRLRRVHLSLLLLLLAAWTIRITVFVPEASWQESAAIGGVPGTFVVGTVAAFYLAALGIAIWPRQRRAKGEFREDYGEWKETESE